MRRRILSFFMTGMLLTAIMIPTAMAATADEINQTDVFLKQQQRGTCTLASTAMMLRRAALLNGDANWNQITESSCRKVFWRAGRGLPYQFSYGDMTVNHARLPGGQANQQVLVDLLDQHPEGIMLHAACVPHGILLTEYKDGQFYCADPSEFAPQGIIPIEQAWGTRVENSSAYWYVASEVAAPKEPPILPEANVSVSLVNLLSSPNQQEDSTCLIAQSLMAAG